MDKPSVKKEISELATSIKTQVDNFGERVSKPELDELIGKVGKLHKRCSVLEHMNAPYNAELAAKADAEQILKEENNPPVVEEKKSEPIITPAPNVESVAPEEPAKALIIEEEEPLPEIVEEPAEPQATNTKKMSIGINDKFQFIKELFDGDAQKYITTIEKLNTIENPEEAESTLKSLQSENSWDEESEIVQRLQGMVKGRYN